MEGELGNEKGGLKSWKVEYGIKKTCWKGTDSGIPYSKMEGTEMRDEGESLK